MSTVNCPLSIGICRLPAAYAVRGDGMEGRFSELRYKEVINIATGARLGYVTDAVFDSRDGRLLALVIPGRSRFFGLFGREEDTVLPWNAICRMGEDIILTDGVAFSGSGR